METLIVSATPEQIEGLQPLLPAFQLLPLQDLPLPQWLTAKAAIVLHPCPEFWPLLAAHFKGPVVYNDPVFPLSDAKYPLPMCPIRWNGWTTCWENGQWEMAVSPAHLPYAETFFAQTLINPLWVPDHLGMISPNVISDIIYEAFLALQSGVATEADINSAMKSGTNYPFGPFEWADKIGLPQLTALWLAKQANQPQLNFCPEAFANLRPHAMAAHH